MVFLTHMARLKATLLPQLVANLVPIPVDISSTDKPIYTPPSYSVIEPITTVATFDGAYNLGVLLWGFVLYQGIFTTAGRPADWVLPLLGPLFSVEKETWYQDFKDGYSFTVPPIIEAARCLMFLFLGYYANRLIIAGFDNDLYWGWAISGALTIPTGLLALARNAEKKMTREMAVLEKEMIQYFDEFAAQRLIRQLDRTAVTPAGQRVITKTPETAIIMQFRRSNEKYRDPEVVSDRMIRRIIRAKVGYKPDKEGDFKYIEMLNLAKESRLKLAENLKKAEEARNEFLRACAEEEECDVDFIGSDFIRITPKS